MRLLSPGWIAAGLAVALVACGESGTVAPPSSDPIDLSIVPISGDGQQGKANEELPEPLVVLVIDAEGNGVAGVDVRWSVDSEDGEFVDPRGLRVEAVVTVTDAQGRAKASFRPGRLGTSTVFASVPDREGIGTTFTVEATVFVIHLMSAFASHCTDSVDPPRFWPGDATVAVGSPVEWMFSSQYSMECEARITSTLEPSGGEPFDSGILRPGDRFEFVPSVVGTWEYVDDLGYQAGTLTVQ
jgi:hypothetical protein